VRAAIRIAARELIEGWRDRTTVVLPGFPADGVARAAALLAVHAVYLLIFALLAVGVSGWVQSSPASLAVLLGLWLVASVVAPRLAVLAADILRPVPSSIAFLQSYEAAIGHKYVDDNSFTAFNETFEGVQQRLMDEYGVKSPAELPVTAISHGRVPPSSASSRGSEPTTR